MKNEKKKFFSAREQDLPTLQLYRYTAHDEKHKFQKFWTQDFENGAKVTSATSLDDLYKDWKKQMNDVTIVEPWLPLLKRKIQFEFQFSLDYTDMDISVFRGEEEKMLKIAQNSKFLNF